MDKSGQLDYKKTLREIYPQHSDQKLDEIIDMVLEDPSDFNDKLDSMVNLLCGDGKDETETINNQYQMSMNMSPLNIGEQLKIALPDADPSYLEEEADKLAKLSQQDVDNFLQNATEKKDYPTLKEYLQKNKEYDELAVYYREFDVQKYLEIIPNPIAVFTDPNRQPALNENSNENDIQYALVFLYNKYRFIRKKYIDTIFNCNNKDLVKVCNRLDKMQKSFIRQRDLMENIYCKNILLLQEITYLKYFELITRVLKEKSETYLALKEEARRFNLFQECQCCFEKEMILEECYFCLNGCVFCKSCVKSGTEAVIGEGRLNFPCFTNCGSEFSLQTLQMVLPKKMFERLTQKIASEEIKKANLEGLETCPFCDFAMVLPESEKIFKCINEECLIESCRKCRHESHIPLRCNEIEYDEDVRRRTYIENKMTEARTRACLKCKQVFIKEGGCNYMACPCGSKQCYLCGVEIQDHSHFGDGKCPLYTDDNQVNLQRVVTSANDAKRSLGDVEIKFDPSDNIESFFQ